jgi:hypothetical protein
VWLRPQGVAVTPPRGPEASANPSGSNSAASASMRGVAAADPWEGHVWLRPQGVAGCPWCRGRGDDVLRECQHRPDPPIPAEVASAFIDSAIGRRMLRHELPARVARGDAAQEQRQQYGYEFAGFHRAAAKQLARLTSTSDSSDTNDWTTARGSEFTESGDLHDDALIDEWPSGGSRSDSSPTMDAAAAADDQAGRAAVEMWV